MRRPLFLVLILMMLVMSSSLVQGAQRSPAKDLQIKPFNPNQYQMMRPPYTFWLNRPDLVATIDGPVNVAAGDDIDINVTIENTGSLAALGTHDGAVVQVYEADVILSADSEFPIQWAVQPVYAGATVEDFVEDMLMLGGRISNTITLNAGQSETYSINTHIPRNIAPGTYYIAAIADPGKMISENSEANNTAGYQINIGMPRPGNINPPGGVNFWVMPYGVGNTTVNNIQVDGKVDYRDGLSGLMMLDAPFGGYLGFRLGYEQHIPLAQIYYYRWLYKANAEVGWHEFTEPVSVHYVREIGGAVSFPVLALGPTNVGGLNLYRFKPHTAPVEAGAVTYWPSTDWFGDIYSGFLQTNTVPDGAYTIKLEIFNNAGVQVMPGGDNNFIVPNGVLGDGTITTRLALPAEIDAGGFIFPLFINNQTCSAYIDAPAIGGSVASDDCGFLIYSALADNVAIGFDAHHPQGYGMFSFVVIRGINTAVSASGEITAGVAGAFTGDGAGNFNTTFSVASLLSPACPDKAAFSENLYVYAKATTGWQQRISGYDASFVRAFALAP